MSKITIYNFLNFIIKFLVILIWIYLYNIGSLTLNRILVFILVFCLIYGYNRFLAVINSIFLNKKVIKYIIDNKVYFNKILNILLKIFKWINPFIIFLIYTDKWLYKLNRYMTSTRFVHYNFIFYVLAKYLLMFGLLKFILYKFYSFWETIFGLTIFEILFKRMYGLILSILIFSNILNYIMNILSYNILIYILIYYVISIACIIWELLYFYYIRFYVMAKLYHLGYKTIASWIFLFDRQFVNDTKMNNLLIFRMHYSWLGHIILKLLQILVPDISQESNFQEDYISFERMSETGFMMTGRILYFKPLKNRISFSYVDILSGHYNFSIFEPTFKLYWECFKSDFNYFELFIRIREIKGRPSLFLYKRLQEIARLYDVFYQPINSLMNFYYFDMKFKEFYNDFDESERFSIKCSLNYLKQIDELRAKLLFFTIWDIEYYYSEGEYKYKYWDYWVIQEDSIMDKSIFGVNDLYDSVLFSKEPSLNDFLLRNKDDLKFYDPEYNMDYLNRLFNVLGIMVSDIPVNLKTLKENFFVSDKFNKYNERNIELLKIMYTHDFKRWEEKRCECSLFSLYEVRVNYCAEEFFQNLRKEWIATIKVEKLEERNWLLLKRTEDLMSNDKSYNCE